MTDGITFSKEEYKDEKIRVYITFDGLFQSNFTGDDDFKLDIDCLERAKHNIDNNIDIRDLEIEIKRIKNEIIAKGWYKDNNGYILIKRPDNLYVTVPCVHRSLHKMSELIKYLEKTGKSAKELFKKQELR